MQFGKNQSPRKKRWGMGWLDNGRGSKVGLWVYINTTYYWGAWR